MPHTSHSCPAVAAIPLSSGELSFVSPKVCQKLRSCLQVPPVNRCSVIATRCPPAAVGYDSGEAGWSAADHEQGVRATFAVGQPGRLACCESFFGCNPEVAGVMEKKSPGDNTRP